MLTSIENLSRGLLGGSLTSSELLNQSLVRIREQDAVISAFTWLNPLAEREAERLDNELAQGHHRGPLHGIPIAVKELFDVATAPREYGSLASTGEPATVDSEIVNRLRDAGAIVVGTTRSHEYGWGITTQNSRRGSTLNPKDLSRIPGGSSGGSAAAVAAGMVPLAVASDTGGSIRIPAAFCGTAGIKPSFGRISRHGGVALAPSLDTPGFIAPRVRDLVAALVAVSGPDLRDPATVASELEPLGDFEGLPDLTEIRLGYAPHLFELEAHTSRRQDFERFLSLAQDRGASLVEIDLPSAAEFRRAFVPIQMAEALHVHRRVLATYPERKDDYGDDVRSRLETATQVTLDDYLQASQTRLRLNAAFIAALSQVDALVTPVSTVAPPRTTTPDRADVLGRDMPLRDAVMGFTTPQNLTGLPAVAFCAGNSSDGLPLGLQVTTSMGREMTALSVAAALEDLSHGAGNDRSES